MTIALTDILSQFDRAVADMPAAMRAPELTIEAYSALWDAYQTANLALHQLIVAERLQRGCK